MTTFSIDNLATFRHGGTSAVAAAAVRNGAVTVDTETCRLYVDLGGSRLDLNAAVPVASAAALPDRYLRIPGKLYYAMAEGLLYWHDGSAWRAISPASTLAVVSLPEAARAMATIENVGMALLYTGQQSGDMAPGHLYAVVRASGTGRVAWRVRGLTPSSAFTPAELALASVVQGRDLSDPAAWNYWESGMLATGNGVTVRAWTNGEVMLTIDSSGRPCIYSAARSLAIYKTGAQAGESVLDSAEHWTAEWLTGDVWAAPGDDGFADEYEFTEVEESVALSDITAGGSGAADAVALWSGDVPGRVQWSADMKSVEITHELSGAPSVAVVDSSGTRVYPTATCTGQTVLLSFEAAMSIPQSAPWTVALFGAEGGVAYSDAPAPSPRVDVDPEIDASSSNPVANRAIAAALDGKADLVDGKVPSGQLPLASSGSPGAVFVNTTNRGISFNNNDGLYVSSATNSHIDGRSSYYNPIVPSKLNYAVKAALTDANHIELSDSQAAVAREVLRVPGLDESGTVPSAQLPIATNNTPGIVRGVPASGMAIGSRGLLYPLKAADDDISARTQQYKPIVPYNLNTAVTAALTDANHIELSDSQAATVRSIIGAMDASDSTVVRLVDGLVPRAQLPMAGNQRTMPGILWVYEPKGVKLDSAGALNINHARIVEIDGGTDEYRPITPDNLGYAVRSVTPKITEIPAATSAYSLLDATSSANSRSTVYTHVPASAPTYTLPAVTDATVAHEITLSVLFSSAVQSCAFQDSAGNTVTPLSSPQIYDGTVVCYLCRYETLLSRWCIMPVVVGEASS